MERGEKIAVIGANGIGKTTFLKSILGLIPAISGNALRSVTINSRVTSSRRWHREIP